MTHALPTLTSRELALMKSALRIAKAALEVDVAQAQSDIHAKLMRDQAAEIGELLEIL